PGVAGVVLVGGGVRISLGDAEVLADVGEGVVEVGELAHGDVGGLVVAPVDAPLDVVADDVLVADAGLGEGGGGQEQQAERGHEGASRVHAHRIPRQHRYDGE